MLYLVDFLDKGWSILVLVLVVFLELGQLVLVAFLYLGWSTLVMVLVVFWDLGQSMLVLVVFLDLDRCTWFWFCCVLGLGPVQVGSGWI